MEIGNSSKLIRDIIKDVKPETVVLEMCQDRYDHWFYDAISHPNYDRTLSDVHKILDSGKVEKLMDYKGLEMAKSSAHLEYLVGLDVCSYRMMPCKTVFGDRSIKITNKRYRSKVKMLEVYKEQLQ
jgi:pheromone shutdown protein TraB